MFFNNYYFYGALFSFVLQMNISIRFIGRRRGQVYNLITKKYFSPLF
jgi:hypothetical protein